MDYNLRWPGLDDLKVYIIDMDTKKIYDEEKTLPARLVSICDLEVCSLLACAQVSVQNSVECQKARFLYPWALQAKDKTLNVLFTMFTKHHSVSAQVRSPHRRRVTVSQFHESESSELDRDSEFNKLSQTSTQGQDVRTSIPACQLPACLHPRLSILQTVSEDTRCNPQVSSSNVAFDRDRRQLIHTR